MKYRETLIDSDGKRWFVTGGIKTWKRDPNRIRVPLKHGLYVYGSLDTTDFRDGVCDFVTLESEVGNDR